jgi:hypothetical protein
MADAPDLGTDYPETWAPITGRVLLYTSRDVDVQPTFSIKHRITPHLGPILQKLADRYSPIRRKTSAILLDNLSDTISRF